MLQYFAVIEKVDDTYSAYLPDVPGCVASGRTREEATQNLKVALKMHLEGMQEDGTTMPEPVSDGDYIAVE